MGCKVRRSKVFDAVSIHLMLNFAGSQFLLLLGICWTFLYFRDGLYLVKMDWIRLLHLRYIPLKSSLFLLYLVLFILYHLSSWTLSLLYNISLNNFSHWNIPFIIFHIGLCDVYEWYMKLNYLREDEDEKTLFCGYIFDFII